MARAKKRREGQSLVAKTTTALREQIFACEPNTLIGSLQDLARSLEVGIVTLQQAARVLEHEGLLEVRRGPGGGYYGIRPDPAALERAMDSYMRMNPTSFEEALDMTSLLFNELATAASHCTDQGLRTSLATLSDRVVSCETVEELGNWEMEFQELLFKMVRRPLFEMLTRVTLHFASNGRSLPIHSVMGGTRHWREGRVHIIAAILANDPDLTRFEANRQNRAVILAHLHALSLEELDTPSLRGP